MSIKLTTEDIRVVGVFERIVGVHIRDCLITDDSVYFLIEPGKMGLAIGKNGINIKNVSNTLGKPVKIFEYAETPEQLVKNLIKNTSSVEVDNGVVTVTIPVTERSAVIGKGGKNIKMVRAFLERHFSIKNLRLK